MWVMVDPVCRDQSAAAFAAGELAVAAHEGLGALAPSFLHNRRCQVSVGMNCKCCRCWACPICHHLVCSFSVTCILLAVIAFVRVPSCKQHRALVWLLLQPFCNQERRKAGAKGNNLFAVHDPNLPRAIGSRQNEAMAASINDSAPGYGHHQHFVFSQYT